MMDESDWFDKTKTVVQMPRTMLILMLFVSRISAPSSHFPQNQVILIELCALNSIKNQFNQTKFPKKNEHQACWCFLLENAKCQN